MGPLQADLGGILAKTEKNSWHVGKDAYDRYRKENSVKDIQVCRRHKILRNRKD